MSNPDERFMKLAIALGNRHAGQTAPNPSVGCVIVAGGRIVGRAATAPGGRPHAEPQALAQAGDLARGATAYVSLEPCAHTGQTPPCAQALIDAGIARVVIATGDPNRQVNGQGTAMLTAAGIKVTPSVCEPRAHQAHRGFLKAQTHGLPSVTLKLAASLDGRVATATGESQWITGEQARRRVHADRARHDAIMVGAATVRTDNPSLDVRDIGHGHQPARIVASRHLDLPLNCKLAQTADARPLFILHAPDADPNLISAWQGLGAHMISTPFVANRQLDLKSGLTQLADAGLTRIYCEGGGALAASLLKAQLVDELHHYQAGKLIGAEGTAMVGALSLEQLTTAPTCTLQSQTRLGPDTLTIWHFT